MAEKNFEDIKELGYSVYAKLEISALISEGHSTKDLFCFVNNVVVKHNTGRLLDQEDILKVKNFLKCEISRIIPWEKLTKEEIFQIISWSADSEGHYNDSITDRAIKTGKISIDEIMAMVVSEKIDSHCINSLRTIIQSDNFPDHLVLSILHASHYDWIVVKTAIENHKCFNSDIDWMYNFWKSVPDNKEAIALVIAKTGFATNELLKKFAGSDPQFLKELKRYHKNSEQIRNKIMIISISVSALVVAAIYAVIFFIDGTIPTYTYNVLGKSVEITRLVDIFFAVIYASCIIELTYFVKNNRDFMREAMIYLVFISILCGGMLMVGMKISQLLFIYCLIFAVSCGMRQTKISKSLEICAAICLIFGLVFSFVNTNWELHLIRSFELGATLNVASYILLLIILLFKKIKHHYSR